MIRSYSNLIKACLLVLVVAAASNDYDTCAASPGGCAVKTEADANTLIQSRVRISGGRAPDLNAEDPPDSDLGDAGVDMRARARDHIGLKETDIPEPAEHAPGEEIGPLENDEDGDDDDDDDHDGDSAGPCALLMMKSKLTGDKTRFRLRAEPARIVDFIQFGFAHELPILHMRLAEMGPLVDEIHIAEGDRDFSGHPKKFELPELLKNDAELAPWLGKIVHHAVHVPKSLSGYEIQQAVLNAKHDISGEGLLLEGDLDELVSRSVLKSLRLCEPIASKGWRASVQMDCYKYSMGWTIGPWTTPTIVHNIGTSIGVAKWRSLLEDVDSKKYDSRANLDNDYFPVEAGYSIYITNGRPAGWHVSWMLDGAEGVANKILRGHIEGMPDWAKPHAASQQQLAAWLLTDFLPNPSEYDPQVEASNLRMGDLPECMVEHPHKYKVLLGDALLGLVSGGKPQKDDHEGDALLGLVSRGKSQKDDDEGHTHSELHRAGHKERLQPQ